MLGAGVPEPCFPRLQMEFEGAMVAIHCPVEAVICAATTGARDEGLRRELAGWAEGQAAMVAAWHAVQMLLRFLNGDGPADFAGASAAYTAALVCWAFGEFGGGEEGWVENADVRVYLGEMHTESWEGLGRVGVRSRRATGGMLTVVAGMLKGCRWGAIEEARQVLLRLAEGRKSV